MSQDDVLKILRKNHYRWFTSQQLSIKMGLTKGAVGESLRKLRRKGLINVIYGVTYTYKYKGEKWVK